MAVRTVAETQEALTDADVAGLTFVGLVGMIDPPRDGAMELVKLIGARGPKRIVYVSCNPATLARDAEILVHAHGYTLEAAGESHRSPEGGGATPA